MTPQDKLDVLLLVRAALNGAVEQTEATFGNPEALAITLPLLRAIDELERKRMELLRKRPGSEGPQEKRGVAC